MASKMLSLLPLVSGKYMDCGSAPLCGVLVIESGLAPSGTYHQDLPGTYGLWPETDSYGTSQCVAPSGSTADPSKVYSCYANSGSDIKAAIAWVLDEAAAADLDAAEAAAA